MRTVSANEFYAHVSNHRDKKYYFTGSVTQTDYFEFPGQHKLLGTKVTQYTRKNSRKIVSEIFTLETN